ncbi:queD like 2 [Pseudoalteromonas sp. MMG013]|uniref:VC2046/SO_2500 family protein n=1 Tax=unclassified Pseudoalteromonas TaxID=194690 RepID=UPI001B362AA3|nr:MULTISPECIES: VC2046/SO_2500 family protein [unclassified Pseudoalteromonas]MBQ4845875.1 queD like 2 [Pseudoalteromonas sp. MMG005]MBQ4861866.1 queD like 2 [Pseudoalteromonas sp. MMG013]
MQIGSILTREDQLGGALSVSVNEQRRADFSMLLAMLSQDALDFSQFHLPEDETVESDLSEDALKKEFQVGPKQSLAPAQFDMLIGKNNAESLSRSSMASLRLANCLDPEPLAIRDDYKHIPLMVVDNCELAVRRRLESEIHGGVAIDKPKMDAAAMYDQLNSQEMQNALMQSA